VTTPLPFTGRARSIASLAQAFALARMGHAADAEGLLHEVVREHLSTWEVRVLEASRALVARAKNNETRVAELAPLALPTGNMEIDQTLARAMIATAWKDDPRLAAIEPALSGGGGPLSDLAALCHLRRRDLAGALDAEEPLELEDASRVADEAKLIGDEALGHRVLMLAERRGVYR
jgi:hypothetical protein